MDSINKMFVKRGIFSDFIYLISSLLIELLQKLLYYLNISFCMVIFNLIILIEIGMEEENLVRKRVEDLVMKRGEDMIMKKKTSSEQKQMRNNYLYPVKKMIQRKKYSFQIAG